MDSVFAHKQNEAILKKIYLASFAINLNFDDYNSYCRRSALYESLGLFKLSLDDAVKAISIDQTKDDGYIHQAKAFTGLKRYSEAEKCLTERLQFTKHECDQILSQLENLRYLAVKQIGFDDRISQLASKKFRTIDEAINGAFSMDLDETTTEDDHNNRNDVASTVRTSHLPSNVINSNLDNSSFVDTASNSTNNQLTNQQLTDSNHNVQYSNVNNVNNVNNLNNGHPNQIDSNVNSSDLNTSLNDRNLNSCANSTLSNNHLNNNQHLIPNSHHHHQHQNSSSNLLDQNQQVQEHPSSTMIDNGPLSEPDIQTDTDCFSSDLHGDLQIRSESDNIIIYPSNKHLPQFTPCKVLVSDLENDYFESSPFTNHSNSSIGFIESLTTPRFNRREQTNDTNCPPLTKKPRVIKNLMNDLIDHSDNHHHSPIYSNSPFSSSPLKCSDSSPFSNISNVSNNVPTDTPKSNVIVSPGQTQHHNDLDDLEELDDLDDLNTSLNDDHRLNDQQPDDTTKTLTDQSPAIVENDKQPDQQIADDEYTDKRMLTEDNRTSQTETTTAKTPQQRDDELTISNEDQLDQNKAPQSSTTLPPNTIIVTSINNLPNFGNLNTTTYHPQITAGSSVIKTPNLVTNPQMVPQFLKVDLNSLNKILLPPIHYKVNTISAVAQTPPVNEKITYINLTNSATVQQQPQEHFNIDKFFKEQDIVVSD